MSVLSECSNITKGLFSSQLMLNVIELIVIRLAQQGENSDEILCDFYTQRSDFAMH